MAKYTYPNNDLNSASKLLSVIGSYWATTYLGMDFISDTLKAKSNITAQTWLNFMELIASISRFTVPVFHHENWYPLVIKESEVNNFDSLIPDYERSTTNVYTSSTSLNYGESAPAKNYFSVSVPTDLKLAKNILSSIIEPSVTWSDSVDYWLPEPGVLVLREDPFASDLFSIKEVFVDGKLADRECILWVYSGEWDYGTVYEQFGYALELYMESSEGYLEIVNAVLDAFTGGTKSKDLQYAWSAITGVPLTLAESEIVELVTEDANATIVVTDKNAYRFAKGSTVIVAAGDKVYAGDALVDTLQIYEFTRGSVPSSLTGLAMGPGFLSLGFFGDLTFENKEVVITVEENVDGYTKVSWPLGGFIEDSNKFWADVHDKGVKEGKTLAMYMDIRANPVDQPTSLNLPTTVNPLEFLSENFLRYNTFLVKINTRYFGKNKLPVIPTTLLRKIIPPQTAMIVLVELVHKDDPVIMDGAGSSIKPGYEETTSSFPCMVITENLPHTYIIENIRVTLVSGRCQ